MDTGGRSRGLQLGLAAASLTLLFGAFLVGKATWLQPDLWTLAPLLAGACGLAVLSVRLSSPTERQVAATRLGVAWVLMAVLAVVGLPVITRDAVPRPYISCISNLKQQALGMIMYSVDHDDRFPLASNWHDATKRYVMVEFHCPMATAKWSYAMNAEASGLSSSDESLADLVLLFEADARLPNASGGPEWLVFRHDDSTHIATCDGKVRARTREQAATLRWKP